jgi:hypothetical protein
MDDGVTREQILELIQAVLKPLDWVYALWEGGSTSFGRTDRWSDLDLHVDVEDTHVGEVIQIIETAIQPVISIALRWEVPQPTWHGHRQVFYKFQNASPFLLLDLAVMRHSSPEKFIQPEIHGTPRVLFDKAGVVTAPNIDHNEWARKLADRLRSLKTMFEIFKLFPVTELERGNPVDALGYYHSLVLRPVVEALRIHHCPMHYNFHTRYVHHDLPPDVAAELEELFFVASPQDLAEKLAQAESLCHKTTG